MPLMVRVPVQIGDAGESASTHSQIDRRFQIETPPAVCMTESKRCPTLSGCGAVI